MAEPRSEIELARDVDNLDGLLRDLGTESHTPTDLMREHLEQARFYLIGSMPQEYRLTLDLAKQLLPDIQDKNLHSRVAAFLRSQESNAE